MLSKEEQNWYIPTVNTSDSQSSNSKKICI